MVGIIIFIHEAYVQQCISYIRNECMCSRFPTNSFDEVCFALSTTSVSMGATRLNYCDGKLKFNMRLILYNHIVHHHHHRHRYHRYHHHYYIPAIYHTEHTVHEEHGQNISVYLSVPTKNRYNFDKLSHIHSQEKSQNAV